MLNISSCWWIVVIRLVRGKLLLLGVCSHNSFRNSVSDQDHIHVTKGPMVHSLTALKVAPSTLVLKFQVILCKQVWSEAILHIVALEYSSFSSLRLCWLLSPTHLLLSLNLDHLHHHWHHFFFYFYIAFLFLTSAPLIVTLLRVCWRDQVDMTLSTCQEKKKILTDSQAMLEISSRKRVGI